jgi:hypothetical protein
MKDAVVSAQTDPELKAQATAVRDHSLRAVSGRYLSAMKRKAQARDHELAARSEVPPAAMLLLRRKRLQGALVEWPDAPLIDDRATTRDRSDGE